MTTERDIPGFFAHQSKAIVQRVHLVRSLIGSAHWGEDGAYKERLVRSALRDVTPTGATVSSGFVLGRRPKDQVSKQLDAFIHDSSLLRPVLEDEDFAVVSASTLLAAFEVKTTLNSTELKKACVTLATADDLARSARPPRVDKRNFPILTSLVAFNKGRVNVPRVIATAYWDRLNKHFGRAPTTSDFRRAPGDPNWFNFPLPAPKFIFLPGASDRVYICTVEDQDQTSPNGLVVPVIRSFRPRPGASTIEPEHMVWAHFLGVVVNHCAQRNGLGNDVHDVLRATNQLHFDAHLVADGRTTALVPKLDGLPSSYDYAIDRP